ncbi:MAG: hypothetical protein QMC33_04105, partial [Octadecabacter sp.]
LQEQNVGLHRVPHRCDLPHRGSGRFAFLTQFVFVERRFGTNFANTMLLFMFSEIGGELTEIPPLASEVFRLL